MPPTPVDFPDPEARRPPVRPSRSLDAVAVAYGTAEDVAAALERAHQRIEQLEGRCSGGPRR
jgi:hypothetical protein